MNLEAIPMAKHPLRNRLYAALSRLCDTSPDSEKAAAVKAEFEAAILAFNPLLEELLEKSRVPLRGDPLFSIGEAKPPDVHPIQRRIRLLGYVAGKWSGEEILKGLDPEDVSYIQLRLSVVLDSFDWLLVEHLQRTGRDIEQPLQVRPKSEGDA